jgi:hypothetical protein
MKKLIHCSEYDKGLANFLLLDICCIIHSFGPDHNP